MPKFGKAITEGTLGHSQRTVFKRRPMFEGRLDQFWSSAKPFVDRLCSRLGHQCRLSGQTALAQTLLLGSRPTAHRAGSGFEVRQSAFLPDSGLCFAQLEPYGFPPQDFLVAQQGSGESLERGPRFPSEGCPSLLHDLFDRASLDRDHWNHRSRVRPGSGSISNHGSNSAAGRTAKHLRHSRDDSAGGSSVYRHLFDYHRDRDSPCGSWRGFLAS